MSSQAASSQTLALLCCQGCNAQFVTSYLADSQVLTAHVVAGRDAVNTLRFRLLPVEDILNLRAPPLTDLQKCLVMPMPASKHAKHIRSGIAVAERVYDTTALDMAFAW